MKRKDIKPGQIVWWADPCDPMNEEGETNPPRYFRVANVPATGAINLAAIDDPSVTTVKSVLPKELVFLPGGLGSIYPRRRLEVVVEYDLTSTHPDELKYDLKNLRESLLDIAARADGEGLFTLDIEPSSILGFSNHVYDLPANVEERADGEFRNASI